MAAPGAVGAAGRTTGAAAGAARWETEAPSGRPGSLKRTEKIQTPSEAIWLLHTLYAMMVASQPRQARRGAGIRDRPLRRTDWADRVAVHESEMEAKAGVEEAASRGAERDANSPATYKGYDTCLSTTNGGLLDRGVYYFLHLLPQSIKKDTTSSRPFPFNL